jgi:hypothetical protein
LTIIIGRRTGLTRLPIIVGRRTGLAVIGFGRPSFRPRWPGPAPPVVARRTRRTEIIGRTGLGSTWRLRLGVVRGCGARLSRRLLLGSLGQRGRRHQQHQAGERGQRQGLPRYVAAW